MLKLSHFFSRLGILFIFIGFFILSYSIWPGFSFLGKSFILFVGFPTLYGLGWVFFRKFSSHVISEIFIFFAALSYGFSLWGLSVLISLNLPWSSVLSLWFLGISSLCFSYQSYLLTYLKFAISIGIIFSIYASFDSTDIYTLPLLCSLVHFLLGIYYYRHHVRNA